MASSDSEIIPSWFSLSNYEPCSDMSLFAWHIAFEARSYLQSTLNNQPVWDGPWFPVEGIFEEMIAGHSSVPNFGDVDPEASRKYAGRTLATNFSSQCVFPMTVGDAARCWSVLAGNEQVKPYADNLLRGMSVDDADQRKKIQELDATPYELMFEKTGHELIRYAGTQVHAVVDLAASEDQLLEDFKNFVCQYKAALALEASRNFTSKDCAKWHKNKVLPYLDLILWCTYCGIDLTHHQIGLILFPEDFDVPLDDRVRRTVRPMALDMLKPSRLGSLRAQVKAGNEAA